MHKFQRIFKKFKKVWFQKNNFTLENLMNYKFKDKAVNSNKPGIYKIKCKDCEGFYIGQTSQNF